MDYKDIEFIGLKLYDDTDKSKNAKGVIIVHFTSKKGTKDYEQMFEGTKESFDKLVSKVSEGRL